MPDTPEQALAAAVRTRLISHGQVALPGFGTLHRTHEPARLEAREDGSRVLLPPRETVTFTPASDEPDADRP